MALPIGRTVTPTAGAGAGLQQTTANKYATTIGAPPPNAQPVGAQGTQSIVPDQTQIQPMTPLYQQQGTGADVQALEQQRAKLVEELFSHDQSLAQLYNDPNSPYYIENPLKAQAATLGPQNTQMELIQYLNSLIGQQQKPLSPTEQKQYYSNALMQDVSAGLTADQLPQLVQKYKSYLPTNDIIDAFQSANPNEQIPYETLLASGYKVPASLAKTSSTITQAQAALKEIQALDLASKQAHQFGSALLQIPGLAGALGAYNPSANYEEKRQAAAQRITKLLYGSNYPGVAENIMSAIPHAYGTEETRAQDIAELTRQVMDVINTAQAEVPNIAFGGSSATSNMASTNQPTTAYNIQPVIVQTSSGGQFSIVPE